MSQDVERSAIRKIYFRLLPIAIVTYFLCYVDRINVGFAALTMRGDIGLSAADFGFAAGTFYWGYFLFEVPSNIIMDKLGARLWIARIMITWGLLSGATMFVTGFESFAILRFFLGLAEAGFFPGLVLFFTQWFPHYHHARIVSGFLMGLPIAVAAGAPISTALLGLNGWLGLQGWQHMYLWEAIPTVLIGFVVLMVLVDKPAQARWLTAAERELITRKIESERRAKEAVKTHTMLQAMFDPKVLLLSLNYLGIVTASLGQLLFIPQIIKSLGVTDNMTVGWLTMVPYICGGISLVVWGQVSDRLDERRWNLFWACVVSTAGLVFAGATMGTWWALAGMSVAAIGFYGSKGPFWAMPPMFPVWHSRRSGDRVDQFDRQPGRFLRALVCRDHAGHDGQLLGWTLRAGAFWAPFFDGVRDLPGHPPSGRT